MRGCFGFEYKAPDRNLERLKNFKVLDPACGSGNFLYLALRALKDLEHKANLEAEMLGLQRQISIEVSPANVLGIEINPYATELARVTVWIGEIQWMLKNCYPIRKNPILQSLDYIENRDALMECSDVSLPCATEVAHSKTAHSKTARLTEAQWPAADVIVGNPPFLGGSKMRGELGDDYTEALRHCYAGRVPGGADSVTYWFEKVRAQIEAGKCQRAGLVATNSIRQKGNRPVLERICDSTHIFNAWSDEPWINDGAAVRVSLVCFGIHPHPNPPPVGEGNLTPSPLQGEGWDGGAMLNGQPVDAIHADLTSGGGLNLTLAKPLQANAGVAFKGAEKNGAFDIEGELARQWLKLPNPNSRPNGHGKVTTPDNETRHARSPLSNCPLATLSPTQARERANESLREFHVNSDVLRPWANGMDIVGRASDTWVIDFGTDTSEVEAALYEAPFQYLLKNVKSEREKNNDPSRKKHWWRFGRTGADMRNGVAKLSRFIVTCRVAKHRTFTWCDKSVSPDSRLFVIARGDDASFGILSSRIHEVWSLATASMHGVGNDPTYNAKSCFETFPFPSLAGESSDIAAAAQALNALRNNWLNPPEWVDWLRTAEEEKADYPARPVAKIRPLLNPLPQAGEGANAKDNLSYAADLKKRTLTNLYNIRPAWLDNAHKTLDAAVARAYGWADYTPDLPDEEILRRLLALNLARSVMLE